jgi:hypothetical protein
MKVKYNKISTIFIILLLVAEIFHLTLAPMFLPISSILVQVSLYGTLVLIILMSFRGVNVEWRMLLFIIFAGISLILSDADARYNAPVRFMTWILLISAVGPLLYNNILIRFRSKLFETTLYVFMLIGGVSFLYWVAGLPNLGRGHFTGIMSHSMLLAPMTSLGGIYAFYRFFHALSLRARYIYFLFFIFNVLSVLLAASRSAFVGLVIGFLILLFFTKFKYKKFLMIIIALFAFGMAANMTEADENISNNNSSELLSEMEKRGMENTRESLWRDRIVEFKAHPVFGVGFASQDDKLLVGAKGSKEGQVEPGSTYLMILSMTGIAGTLAMLFFLSKLLLSRNFWRVMTRSEQYKLASFAFFSVHFLAEGYLFASGSLMAFVFWTLVGSTYHYLGIMHDRTKGNS